MFLFKKNNYLSLFLKSIPIGLANTLPGISGGTIALVLNIYETLINSIKNIRIKRLIIIASGAVIGVYIGSSLITDFYRNSPLIVNYFLFALVLTSAHSTYKKIGKFSYIKLLIFMAAFTAALFFSIEIELDIQSSGLLLYFAGGFFGSIAMILPGISGGTLLILMGLYHPLLNAINNFEILFLSIFSLGIVIGLLVFAWLFSYLLKKYRQEIMTILTGLILGSSAAVFPSEFSINGIFAFLAGTVLILILELIGKNT
jgi:putative membrane protein